ncbi:MAG: hypothetical protein ACYSU1_04305 [Planctomycetota bacterium]|jgi:hypothetical protein
MNPMLLYIHDQVMGFLKAGKDTEPAGNAVDRGASKAFGGLLVVVGVALAVVPLFLDFLSPRVALRSILVSVMVFGVACKFLSGASLFGLIGEMLRYWIPFAWMIYAYLVVGMMAVSLLKGGESTDYAFHGGIMMATMGFLGAVTTWLHARLLGEGDPEGGGSHRVAIYGLRLYSVVWLAFLCGGLFMFAWATGWADWFFVEVLGW